MKWVIAILVYFATKRIGLAILAFLVASLFEGNISRGGRRRSNQDFFEFYQQRASMSNVATMLMALSAAVMKADGKVLKAELDYVKNFFSQQFGNQFNREHLQVLKRFLDAKEIPLDRICNDIRSKMPAEVRVQLVHYMFGIAKADGDVAESEMRVIQSIAQKLGVSQKDFESLKNMFYRDVHSDYKILGVDASATDDEVKKAYRKMAIAHHPDKVASMGEEYQKGAQEKFMKIQEAYENIKKKRGFK